MIILMTTATTTTTIMAFHIVKLYGHPQSYFINLPTDTPVTYPSTHTSTPLAITYPHTSSHNPTHTHSSSTPSLPSLHPSLVHAPYAPATLSQQELFSAYVEGVTARGVCIMCRQHRLDVVLPGKEGVWTPQHLRQLHFTRRNLQWDTVRELRNVRDDERYLETE